MLSLAEEGLRTISTDAHFAIMHGWFLSCVDSVRGALLLEDAGLGRTADPLIRAAIEHAVGMLWLRQLGWPAVEAVGRSHQRWAQNVRKAVKAADEHEARDGRQNWSAEQQTALEAIADQEIPEGKVDGEWKIDKRFTVTRAYDLYVAWLSETGMSHATQSTATPYVTFQPARQVLLREPKGPRQTVHVRCAAAALVAFKCMGEAMQSEIWAAIVAQLDGELSAAQGRAESSVLLDSAGSANWS